MLRAASFAVAVLLGAMVAAPASAATVHKKYSASLNGNHGSTTLTVYTNRGGKLELSLRSMTAGSWSVALWRGTCASPSSRIVSLSALNVPSSGRATRTSAITTTVMARLAGGRVAIRLSKAGAVVCASLGSVSLPPTSSGSGVAPATGSNCHPSYQGACLDPRASDYDCAGGSGNGPKYTGPVRVVGYDEYDLDRDNDGWGCE